jgi:sterol desaturase/sphingolipid hydroxylase (fatty acid hydroxylase superfamily)
LNLIVLAIPVFFLLIGVELLVAWLARRRVYSLSDSVNDLSCGVLDQLLDVGVKTGFFAGYLWLYEQHRVLQIPMTSAAAWVACFVGVDFLYYWFHRSSHEINFLWAAHVVHHQSEEYNLTVALRQGALQGCFSWVFYLPLALLGFPPAMFLTLTQVNTLYQFWIHTRLIGRLGPLEWVLNTPSHHRVHHGRNPEYIDRNHGGTLIVWDRLFGTFAQEREEPVYGITRPLASWNPLWANAQYWHEMAEKAGRASRIADRLRMFVKPPGWLPEELGGFQPAPPVDRASYRKFGPPLARGLGAYVLVQYVALLAIASAFLFLHARWPLVHQVAVGVFIVLSVVVLGALTEGRIWARPVEAARLLAGGLAVLLLGLPG